MSTLVVEVCIIEKIENHPAADRLDIATVKGWNCVVTKDKFKVGDKCVYIPIDSVLTQELEEKLFAGGKIQLHNHRIKTIKLRGAISQGLVESLDRLGLPSGLSVGTDVSDLLKITKFEPQERHPGLGTMNPAKKKSSHEDFKKYTHIENFKNYNRLFQEGEEVIITEKIHGTNFRCGYVKAVPNTLWKKIKVLFGKDLGWEFVYGSHNVELSNSSKKGFYSTNVYAEAVEKYNLRDKLQHGQILYGEIYGKDIQKGYTYGIDEHRLVVFDIMENGEYQDTDKVQFLCYSMHVDYVPILYEGPFSVDVAKKYASGPSVINPSQKFREGGVIRPKNETTKSMVGRKILKYVSDEYLLLKDNSDWH